MFRGCPKHINGSALIIGALLTFDESTSEDFSPGLSKRVAPAPVLLSLTTGIITGERSAEDKSPEVSPVGKEYGTLYAPCVVGDIAGFSLDVSLVGLATLRLRRMRKMMIQRAANAKTAPTATPAMRPTLGLLPSPPFPELFATDVTEPLVVYTM